MIMPFILCLYLVAIVIDPIWTGVWTNTPWLIWKAGIYLLILVILVLLFQREFKHLAEQEQTKLVFTPRVFTFFAYACSAWVTARMTRGDRSTFLAVSIVGSIGIYRIGSRIFQFYPIPTRQSSRARWISLLILGCTALYAFLPGLWSSVRNQIVNQGPLSTQKENIDTQEGVELAAIIDQGGENENIGISGDVVVPPSTGGNIDGDDESGTRKSEGMVLSGIVTYATLFQALNEKGVLPAITQQPAFSLIPNSSPLYESFQRAWGLKLIGTNINPNRQVRCENLMVVLGIIQEREVSAGNDILGAYRRVAEEKNALGNCSDQNAVARDIVLN